LYVSGRTVGADSRKGRASHLGHRHGQRRAARRGAGFLLRHGRARAADQVREGRRRNDGTTRWRWSGETEEAVGARRPAKAQITLCRVAAVVLPMAAEKQM